MKDKFRKLSTKIHKKSLETTIKYKKKCVRERRIYGTATIVPAGIRAGRETDPGESGRDRPEFCQNRMHLSRIDRSGAYKLKGYHSVTEYARETFGMAPDGVSRFIHVYEKYSIQGDTPELREEYRDFNFSQLTEMLQLPEEDHTMIRPETKREDIRDLKKFNKQSQNNPDNLLNWQQDPDDIIREAVKEFFKARKKDLNEIYDQYGVGPYPEEEIKKMARFLYHEKKKKFQTNRVFVMLYPDQVFIKSSDGELHDITWPEFFQTMGSIFVVPRLGKTPGKIILIRIQTESSRNRSPARTTS